MFRLVLVATLATLAVAQNSSDVTSTEAPTEPAVTVPATTVGPLDDIAAAVKECTGAYRSLSAAEKADCANINQLSKCLVVAKFSMLEGTVKNTDYQTASLVLELAVDTAVTPCVESGDLSFDVSQKNPAKLFRFSTESIDIVATAKTLESIKDNAAYTATVSAHVAEVDRFIDDATTALKIDILREVSKLEQEAAEDKIELEQKMGEMEDAVMDTLDEMDASLTATVAELEDAVDAQIAVLTETATEALASYKKQKSWPNASDDSKWHKQYELIQVARAPADTENGHAGRMMYKVNFNPNLPGFWYPERDEFYRACTALSDDLKSVDGVDRALKPACDQDWACDGNSVQLRGSYLSHCGCGGYPRQRQCVGMSNNFLRGAAMYNRHNSWNGCWMLRHDGRDCHHHWSDCYQRRGVRSDFTICTSSNANYKK